jgi:hypothetical protein
MVTSHFKSIGPTFQANILIVDACQGAKRMPLHKIKNNGSVTICYDVFMAFEKWAMNLVTQLIGGFFSQ